MFFIYLQKDKINEFQENIDKMEAQVKDLRADLDMLSKYEKDKVEVSGESGTKFPDLKTGKMITVPKPKLVEGFYCKQGDGDFLVMRFKDKGEFLFWSVPNPAITYFDEQNTKVEITGRYLLDKKIIFMSFPEQGLNKTRRFSVNEVDSRGYILQIESHDQSIFQVSACPSELQSKY